MNGMTVLVSTPLGLPGPLGESLKGAVMLVDTVDNVGLVVFRDVKQSLRKLSLF